MLQGTILSDKFWNLSISVAVKIPYEFITAFTQVPALLSSRRIPHEEGPLFWRNNHDHENSGTWTYQLHSSCSHVCFPRGLHCIHNLQEFLCTVLCK
ncbi:hypothetical protein Mapa_000737 [Marchantia paleacea]|nr:hypothetical protein Mapa_000737 [Marchantia paleacea]